MKKEIIWSKNTPNNQPLDKERVLVYSPVYPLNDPMRLRIMEGQFVRICTDATYWAYIEEPIDLGER